MSTPQPSALPFTKAKDRRGNKSGGFYFNRLPEEIVRLIFKNIFFLCNSIEEVKDCIMKLLFHSAEMASFLSDMFNLSLPLPMSIYCDHSPKSYSSTDISFHTFLVDIGPTAEEMFEYQEKFVSTFLFEKVNWTKKKELKFTKLISEEAEILGRKDDQEYIQRKVNEERALAWTKSVKTAHKAIKYNRKAYSTALGDFDLIGDSMKDCEDEFDRIELRTFGKINYSYYIGFLTKQQGMSVPISRFLMRKGTRNYVFTEKTFYADLLIKFLNDLPKHSRVEKRDRVILGFATRLMDVDKLYPKNLDRSMTEDHRKKLLEILPNAIYNCPLDTGHLSGCDFLWDFVFASDKGDFATELVENVFSYYGNVRNPHTNIPQFVYFLESKGISVKQCIQGFKKRESLLGIFFVDVKFYDTLEIVTCLAEIGVNYSNSCVADDPQTNMEIIENMMKKYVCSYDIYKRSMERIVEFGVNCDNLPGMWDMFMSHKMCNVRDNHYGFPDGNAYCKYWKLDKTKPLPPSKRDMIVKDHLPKLLYSDSRNDQEVVIDILTVLLELGINVFDEKITYSHVFEVLENRDHPIKIDRTVTVLEHILDVLQFKEAGHEILYFIFSKWHDFDYIKNNCPEVLAPIYLIRNMGSMYYDISHEDIENDKYRYAEYTKAFYDLYVESDALREQIKVCMKIQYSYVSYMSVCSS